MLIKIMPHLAAMTEAHNQLTLNEGGDHSLMAMIQSGERSSEQNQR